MRSRSAARVNLRRILEPARERRAPLREDSWRLLARGGEVLVGALWS
ncbi:hypothetical protein [Micromonospora ureilytica]|nr:hypothetical protein OHB55_14130 [Micromonospora ureilytica]